MDDFLTVSSIMQGVIISLILWLLKLVYQINGAIKELREWRKGHVKLVDERHKGLKENIERIWEKVNG